MATYGKILLIAMPFFLLLVLFEKWWGWYKGNDTVRNMDMISSLSSGITNVTKDVLGLTMIIYSYGWMVDHWALTHVRSSVWNYIIAFVALDLAGYWIHRMAHEVNVFWNNHIIHHSSEEYNLACALRQSISVFVRVFTVLLLPAALLGVPQEVIAVVAPLHLFVQFWYHTQHIGKMGFLEKIIVTPSHHRVHHAINPEYLDKNFSEVFIIWDHLFGTFQPELDAVPAVYGVTRPVNTWNPIKINFMHLKLLLTDAWYTKSWRDKGRIWFMPTGWRPADRASLAPINKIDDLFSYKKYDTPTVAGLTGWCWFQMVMLLLFVSWLFSQIIEIGQPEIYLYGLFIFLFVYALTELMDGHPLAYIWESVKSLLGISFLLYQGSWFGLTFATSLINVLLFAYFLSAPLVSFLLLRKKLFFNFNRVF